jgi:hypothetical protein
MSLACPSLIGDFAPQLCRAIDVYCERTSGGLAAEPINAITNLGYFIAAWAAWRLQTARPNSGAHTLILALLLAIVAIGLGSLAFHTIATAWASWADVIPILVFMLLFLWLTLTRFFRWPAPGAWAALAVFFVITFSLEAFVPERILWGGAYAVPTLFVMLIAGGALRLRHSPAANALLAAAGLFVLSFTFRTLDMTLCQAIPVGTHFMWHALNATLLFLLVRAAVLFAPAATTARNRAPTPTTRPGFP